jgi:hypothetical protein
VRPGRSCGTVDSTGVLPPDPTVLSGICGRCIPVASSGSSVNDHAIVSVPFACPEFRRAQPHPRKPFLATRHWLAQRRNTADEGPPTTEILIANPELEFRLTHRKLSQLKIPNRKKSAIFYPVFRRSAKTVLPPSFPSGTGFIPSVTDRGNISVPIVYPEDARRRRRALTHPCKPFMVFLSSKKNATSTCPLPLALTHPRKPSPFFPFWHDAASRRSRSAEFLIANARLEFTVSHSKEGPLKIPNRERISISNRIQPPRPRSARHLPLITRHCNPHSARKLTPSQRTPILILPPKENRHGKPRHTKRRPNPNRKIHGRALPALRG